MKHLLKRLPFSLHAVRILKKIPYRYPRRLEQPEIFNEDFYLKAYPDVAIAGIAPKDHYITSGSALGFSPMPLEPALEKRLVPYRATGNSYTVALRIAFLIYQNQLESAFKIAAKARGTSDAIILWKGRAYQSHGDLSTAETFYLRLAKRHGEWITAIHVAEVAFLLEDLGHRHVAIEGYRRALELGHPTTDLIAERLSVLLFGEGLAEEANHLRKTYIRTSQDIILETVSVKSQCEIEQEPYKTIIPARTAVLSHFDFLDGNGSEDKTIHGNCADEIYAATLHNCNGFSKCNLLVHRGRVVCDLAAHHLSSQIILGDKVIMAHHENRIWLRPPMLEQTFPAGLKMFGAQSQNYGHWVAEFLPRMLVFDTALYPSEWPLYVDEDMPTSHFQALDLLNSMHRPIIRIPKDTKIHFEALGISPVPAFFPLQLKNGKIFDTIWPNDVFAELSEKVRMSVGVPPPAPTPKRKIFLTRKGFGSRKLLNEADIESYLASNGFEIIQPEKMNFAEQVRLFNDAAFIVASCSSALTNALFCRPNAHIIGLIHAEPFNFRAYASFVQSGGGRILFVRGTTATASLSPSIHSDYTVSVEQIKKALAISGLEELNPAKGASDV